MALPRLCERSDISRRIRLEQGRLSIVECQGPLLLLNHSIFGSIVSRVGCFFGPSRFVDGVPFGKDVRMSVSEDILQLDAFSINGGTHGNG